MENTSRPLDVICMCSADGDIRPLRLRMEDDNREYLRMDISEILGVERNMRFGAESITFLCRGRTADKWHLLELRYSVRTYSWCILRDFSQKNGGN